LEPIDFAIHWLLAMMLRAEARSAPLLEEGSAVVMDASLVQILDFMYKVPKMVLFSGGMVYH
jgi:hypothetical protein